MPSGGHARSGPAADPNSERSRSGRNAKDGWIDLPARISKQAPRWPLERMTTAEADLWKVLWKKPQSDQWRTQGLLYQVAAYARSFLEATDHGAPASLKTAVLRMEDVLGLSTVGMTALRWRFAVDDVAAKRDSNASGEPAAAPVRRLRATA